jgi:hypothetical protein
LVRFTPDGGPIEVSCDGIWLFVLATPLTGPLAHTSDQAAGKEVLIGPRLYVFSKPKSPGKTAAMIRNEPMTEADRINTVSVLRLNLSCKRYAVQSVAGI